MNQPEARKIYVRLNWSSIITFFGTGLSWTGLPYLAVMETSNAKAFSLLFFIQCLLGMVGNAFGGKSGDKWGARPILLFGSALAVLTLCVGYILYDRQPVTIITVIGISTSFISSLTTPALQMWLGRIIKNFAEEYEVSYAKRDTQIMLAKLLGFGLGPIVYGFLKKQGLLVDALTFFLEFVLIFSISGVAKTAIEKPEASPEISLKYLVQNSGVRRMLTLSLLTGLIMYPLISAALSFLHLALPKSGMIISVFWVCATLGSVAANTFVAKAIKASSNKAFFQGMAIGVSTLSIIFVLLGRNSPVGVILGFCLFTLSNPVLMTIQRANFIRDCEENYLGRLMGAHEFLFNGGATFAIFIFFLMNETFVLYGLILVSILRFWVVSQYYKNRLVPNES